MADVLALNVLVPRGVVLDTLSPSLGAFGAAPCTGIALDGPTLKVGGLLAACDASVTSGVVLSWFALSAVDTSLALRIAAESLARCASGALSSGPARPS